MNTGLICVGKHSFFEGHNHPLIFAPPLSCQASPPPFSGIFPTPLLKIKSPFQHKFSRNPPLQTKLF